MDTEVKHIVLHVGNGTVYLQSEAADTLCINMDVQGLGSRLVSGDPSGPSRWGTTLSRYYDRHAGIIEELKRGIDVPPMPCPVCDIYGEWRAMPFADASVDEIISYQVFEHLSMAEAAMALGEARRVLKPDGVLRLSVPDIDATLQAMCEMYAAGNLTACKFYKRHITGSRKANWAYHVSGWTKERLIDFCAEFGFSGLGDDANQHDYPSIVHSFRRVAASHHPEFDQHVIPWKAAYEYCGDPLGTPLTVPDDWKVLEVGPGNAPWPRADFYVDIAAHDWENFTLGNVEAMPFDDRSFDYILISHCLEHVVDPIKAASELSRISRHGGTVICPSLMKEGIFAGHESDHRWHVIQAKGRLLFKKVPDDFYQNIFNEAVSGQAHRALRFGDSRLGALGYEFRKWWKATEQFYDVIHRWGSDGLKIEILE